MSESTTCPGCGTCVSAGAADCERCGHVIAPADDVEATHRGVWLTILLSLSIVGATFTLIDDLWAFLKPTRASSPLAEIGYPLAHAAVLFGSLRMWRLRRSGAATYFPMAVLLVAIAVPNPGAIATASLAYQALQYLPLVHLITLGVVVYLNWPRFR